MCMGRTHAQVQLIWNPLAVKYVYGQDTCPGAVDLEPTSSKIIAQMHLCSLTFTFSTVVCMVLSSAVSCFHGATDPGKLNTMCSPSTTNSATYVILMRTQAPGGKFPTLTVNTSYMYIYTCTYIHTCTCKKNMLIPEANLKLSQQNTTMHLIFSRKG